MIERHSDRDAYWKFTGPARLQKSIHTLDGILQGISADGVVTAAEVQTVSAWIDEHWMLAHRHPFTEIIPAIRSALSDGKLEVDEVEDLRWLCAKLRPGVGCYDDITCDMQELHGLMGGIIADGDVVEAEVDVLRKWMDDHDHLRTCWPYDEIDSLLTEVRKDRVIDDRDRALLRVFFAEWTSLGGRRAIGMPLNETNTPITGLCAVCPEVTVSGKLLCFTGASKNCTRAKFKQVVESKGGTFWPDVKRSVDYLVIGAEGNPCWAYACYGRKVEHAIKLRKEGFPILIVHEHDFWDAIA